MKLINKSALVFMGDSVTEAFRSAEIPLGNGFVALIARHLQRQYPELSIQIFNRGTGGDTAGHLAQRWQRDCLSLTPAIVTVLVGINDCCYRYYKNAPISPEEFQAHYRAILEKTKETGAQIILLEPFVLHHPQDRLTWREDLNPKIEVVRRLANEYSTGFIPLDTIFQQAAKLKPPAFFAGDGVHPTPAGHAIIAREWLKLFSVD